MQSLAQLPERSREGQGPFSAFKGVIVFCLVIQGSPSRKNRQPERVSSKDMGVSAGGVLGGSGKGGGVRRERKKRKMGRRGRGRRTGRALGLDHK